MENSKLRECFEKATNSLVEKFKRDEKCIAAFLMGSTSHDLIWEWSDLELLIIYDDSYKGPSHYHLLEFDVAATVKIVKRSSFKDYLGRTNVSDYWFCALSKSTLIFTKDITLKEYFEDIFYIGDRDREIEMLLGFSQAIYYLNKAEKNFRVKGNSHNAAYFLFQLAEGIAWLEVARERAFPEREIIAQASKINPELFVKIYDPLLNETVNDDMIHDILEFSYQYLKDNTLEVYNPVISYLKAYKTLEKFSLKTRTHGFGINFEWLYRMEIVERYVEPVKINNKSESFLQIGYRINDRYESLR